MNTVNSIATVDVAGAENLPTPVRKRALTEAQWRTLKTSVFPGAQSESVLMFVDYCKARRLDPMKKPAHIVPMKVRNADTGNYEWRDVIMPGIYEYRTTAHRTGEYLGHSKPEYGPEIEYLGIEAPEWCEITVYRWNAHAKQRTEFPTRVLFREIAATKRDKSGHDEVNARWSKAPVQMLTKCAEAAGLREAFPDELGGEPTMEEMGEQDFSAPQRRSERSKRVVMSAGDYTNGGQPVHADANDVPAEDAAGEQPDAEPAGDYPEIEEDEWGL
jgi:phage recombination protein Bet